MTRSETAGERERPNLKESEKATHIDLHKVGSQTELARDILSCICLPSSAWPCVAVAEQSFVAIIMGPVIYILKCPATG